MQTCPSPSRSLCYTLTRFHPHPHHKHNRIHHPQIHTPHLLQPLQRAVALQRLCDRRCSFCPNFVVTKAVHTTTTRAPPPAETHTRDRGFRVAVCAYVCACVGRERVCERERETANAHNNTARGSVVQMSQCKTKQNSDNLKSRRGESNQGCIAQACIHHSTNPQICAKIPLLCSLPFTYSRYASHVFLAMLRIFFSVFLIFPNSPFFLALLSLASTRLTTSWSLIAVCCR